MSDDFSIFQALNSSARQFNQQQDDSDDVVDDNNNQTEAETDDVSVLCVL